MSAIASGFAYHPQVLLELLRLAAWLAVVIIIVSFIALTLTQGRL